MPWRVLAGHETSPTGSAVGGVGIGVHEDHTVLGQFVDVGAFVVFRPHVPEISPAQVVDEKEHDVRLGCPIHPEKSSGKEYGTGDGNKPKKSHLHMRTRSRVLVKWVEGRQSKEMRQSPCPQNLQSKNTILPTREEREEGKQVRYNE